MRSLVSTIFAIRLSVEPLLHGQQDNQIDHVADAISTYVGHAKVSDTYWYISATSELMSEASQRFSRFSSGGCQ